MPVHKLRNSLVKAATKDQFDKHQAKVTLNYYPVVFIFMKNNSKKF